ncbi:MAG: hypothetical protein PUC65_16650 [Clostridiales bacterium]|nr:hypothetical protein [Clostridiales bacterium]
MLFQEKNEVNGWTIIDFSTTWPYNYDIMLDLAQTLINVDFQDSLQRCVISDVQNPVEVEHLQEVRAKGYSLRSTEAFQKECNVIVLAGLSKTMECPIQVALFKDSNRFRLFCADKSVFVRYGEHAFDNYVNSIEIRAYRRDAERKMLEAMDKEKMREQPSDNVLN